MPTKSKKTTLIKKSKNVSGQSSRNLQENGLSRLFDLGAKAISKILTPINDWANTYTWTTALDEMGHPIVQANDLVLRYYSSPASTAAGISAMGHIASQAAEKTPLYPIGNAIDIATTIPDATFDVINWGAKQDGPSFGSVLVDIPEIFPGHVDDAAALAGFADDLNQATGGKAKQYIQKAFQNKYTPKLKKKK